jgi:hypothetical protein
VTLVEKPVGVGFGTIAASITYKRAIRFPSEFDKRLTALRFLSSLMGSLETKFVNGALFAAGSWLLMSEDRSV